MKSKLKLFALSISLLFLLGNFSGCERECERVRPRPPKVDECQQAGIITRVQDPSEPSGERVMLEVDGQPYYVTNPEIIHPSMDLRYIRVSYEFTSCTSQNEKMSADGVGLPIQIPCIKITCVSEIRRFCGNECG